MDASVRDGKTYAFGRFRLDPARRTLTADALPVPLSPTVFDTLLYLVENPGRIVTKTELMDAIWPRKVVEESNISQTIFTLRKALAGAEDAEPYIVTHPGKGYRFVAPVETHTPPFAAAPIPAPRASRRGLVFAGLGTAIVLVAALVVGGRLWLHHAPPARRLVVMGQFANLTGEANIEQTFAEATRTEMAQSPFLTVMSDRRVKSTLGLMTRPPDAPTTPAVLQEVCARNDGLAVVHGVLARVGGRYLVTLGADDCTSGELLASEKAEASSRDALLTAFDDVTSRLRKRLGESSSSVRDFSVPLRQARTASFEALQAFSRARDDVNHGKRADAIPLFEQAIALDPNFASAHAELAIQYYNQHQLPEAVEHITAARRLMGGMDTRARLAIEGGYNIIVDKDTDAELRIIQRIIEIFPRDAEARANLANVETWIGHPELAIAPGREAVALEPDVEAAYVVLARAYLHAGRFAEARAVCRAAEARKFDGDDLHGVAYQTEIAQGDTVAAARDLAWASGKAGERNMLVEAGQYAYRLGQVERANALFARAVALGKGFGLGDYIAAPNARLLFHMGLVDRARASLAMVPPDQETGDYRFDQAEFGDAAAARRILDAALAKSPRDTLLNKVFAPEVRAALALRAGKPRDAIEALRPVAPYELRTYDTLYLRGTAYLAAHDGPGAVGEFRKILDHPGVEPVSVLYPLAHLGIARAEALSGDRAAAMAAYRAFFQDWKDADPGMPLLIAAKAEYARLARPA